MKDPLISLIIPMHNTEKFIAECLDSAINQTYRNIEIIVVDDDSKDGSAEITKAYQKKRNNISYIKTKNGNAAKTRRDGLKESKAGLVCFVDSDDVLDEKYVERLYGAMKETGVSISACNIDIFSDEFKETRSPLETRPYTLDSTAGSFADHYHMSDTNKLTLQTMPCKLFKKELFNDLDYTVLVTNIFEDNFILAQILSKVEKIGVVDETLYWYRQATGTTSGDTVKTTVDYNGEKLNSIEFFRDVVMAYCRKTLKGPNVDAAIDRLSADEFFNYARMVPDLLAHKEYLEQKIELDRDTIQNYDVKTRALLESKSYRIGRSLTGPARVVKKIMKNGSDDVRTEKN